MFFKRQAKKYLAENLNIKYLIPLIDETILEGITAIIIHHGKKVSSDTLETIFNLAMQFLSLHPADTSPALDALGGK